jgi:hypothetical protein
MAGNKYLDTNKVDVEMLLSGFIGLGLALCITFLRNVSADIPNITRCKRLHVLAVSTPPLELQLFMETRPLNE